MTGNVVNGGPGITASGGGLFNTAGVPDVALTLTCSPITGNRPDDCDGCTAPAAAAANSPAGALRPRGGARLR